MKKQLWMSLALVSTLLGVASCRWLYERPKVVTLEELKGCPSQFDNKHVAVEAYLGIDPTYGYLYCADGCYLMVSSEPDNGTKKLQAYVHFGNGPNQMNKLPEEFIFSGGRIPIRAHPLSEEQLRRFHESLLIRTNENKPVGARDRVRIIGVFDTYPGDDHCSIEVKRIEQP